MTLQEQMKRTMDIVIASTLLVICSPLLALIAVAILWCDGSPVLFRQQRPGRYGRAFTFVKFRTMREPEGDEDPWTTDDARMTRIGRILRRTSLDELPELAHVVTGRMSLVGPRPLVMEYLPRYSGDHRRRHNVRPGITGLAQVSGRRTLTLGQRLDLDVQYVDNWTVRGDLVILGRTLLTICRPGDVEGQKPADVDDVGFHSPAGAGRE